MSLEDFQIIDNEPIDNQSIKEIIPKYIINQEQI